MMKRKGILTVIFAILLGGAFFGTRALLTPSSKTTTTSSDAGPAAKSLRPGASEGTLRGSRREFVSAMNAAQKADGLFSRRAAIARVVSSPGADVSALRQQLLKGDPSADLYAMAAVARRWAANDPEGLLAFLQESRPELLYESAITRALMDEWALSDPDGALAAVNEAENPWVRDALTSQMLGRLLFHDLERAFEIVSAMGHRPYIGLETGYEAWVDADFAGAADRIKALPLGNFRMSNVLNLSVRWGRSDPQAALQFASVLEPIYSERAAFRVIIEWWQRDPVAAREHLESQASTGVRTRLGPVVAGHLAKENPRGAFEWVEEHLGGRARVAAVRRVINEGAQTDPGATAEIANGLAPGPIKNEAIRSVARAWFGRDPGGAAAWAAGVDPGYGPAVLEGLQNSGLDAQAQQAARAAISGGAE